MRYQGFQITARGKYCSFYSHSPREAPSNITSEPRSLGLEDWVMNISLSHISKGELTNCTHYTCLHLTSQPSHTLGFSSSPNYSEDHLALHRLLVPKQPNMQVTFSFSNTWTQTGHKKNHRLHFLHHYCPQTHQKHQEGGGRKGSRINYHNKNGKGHQIFFKPEEKVNGSFSF